MTEIFPVQSSNKVCAIDDFFHFPEAFEPAELEIIKDLGQDLLTTPAVAGGKVDLDYRSSEIGWIDWEGRTQWIYERMAFMAAQANEQYYNFRVSGLAEGIQFTNYDAERKGKYDFHMDCGIDTSHRKLSICTLLSQPDVDFTGGEFEFLTAREPKSVPLKAGAAVVFPSIHLHRVKQLTSGKRQSLVTWVSGPSWT